MKTKAALVRNGQCIGYADTSARSGEMVSYGAKLTNGGLFEHGRAKVSRAKKWFVDDDGSGPWYDVNRGGGPAI